MKSRRRSWKKLLFMALLIISITAPYAHYGLFPGALKIKAQRFIQLKTGKTVQFSKAIYVPFHGLSLYDVGVFHKDGRLLFKTSRMTINAKLLPFLKTKRILIHRFLLEKPVLDLALNQLKSNNDKEGPKTILSGAITVPVAGENKRIKLQDALLGPDYFLPENVYIQRIEISGGRLIIRNNPGDEPLEILPTVNLRLEMTEAPLLRFDGRLVLGEKPYGHVDAVGVWDLKQARYRFNFKARSKIVPPWLKQWQAANFMRLDSGQIYVDGKLFGDGESQVFFESALSLRESTLLVSKASYSGQLKLSCEGIFDTNLKKLSHYKGELDLIKVNAKNVTAKILLVRDLQGLARFQRDLMEIPKISGLYEGIQFSGSGSIRSFKELNLFGEIRSQLDAKSIPALLPPQDREIINGFVFSGDCQALTTLRGNLKQSNAIITEHKIVLQNGSIHHNKNNIHLINLSGEIETNVNGINIRDCEFQSANTVYRVSLSIPKDRLLPGNLSLQSKKFNFESDYRMVEKSMRLSNAKMQYMGINLAFNGECENYDKSPTLNIYGTLNTEFTQLIQIYPNLSRYKLSGTITGLFTLRGPLTKWTAWDLKVDAKSTHATWSNWYRLSNLDIKLRLLDGALSLPLIRAETYDGVVGVKGSVDVASVNKPFSGEIYVNNVDIEKIAKDLPSQKNMLKGNLSGNIHLDGLLMDAKSFRGQGVISITNGILWQTDKFKAMGELPLLKVEGLDWVTFNELNGSFVIKNNRLNTDDLTLLGDSVDLSLSGFIGFDSQLDFKMNIQYSEAVNEGAALTGGFAPVIVSNANRFISAYRLSGSLSKTNDITFEKMALAGKTT